MIMETTWFIGILIKPPLLQDDEVFFLRIGREMRPLVSGMGLPSSAREKGHHDFGNRENCFKFSKADCHVK